MRHLVIVLHVLMLVVFPGAAAAQFGLFVNIAPDPDTWLPQVSGPAAPDLQDAVTISFLQIRADAVAGTGRRIRSITLFVDEVSDYEGVAINVDRVPGRAPFPHKEDFALEQSRQQAGVRVLALRKTIPVPVAVGLQAQWLNPDPDQPAMVSFVVTCFDWGGYFKWSAHIHYDDPGPLNGLETIQGTRIPTDKDRDGIADSWEKRFAKDGDIEKFKPTDDEDEDAFRAGDRRKHLHKGDRFTNRDEYRGLYSHNEHLRFDKLPDALDFDSTSGPKRKDVFVLASEDERPLTEIRNELSDTGIAYHYLRPEDTKTDQRLNEHPAVLDRIETEFKIDPDSLERSGIVNWTGHTSMSSGRQVAIRILDLELKTDSLASALAEQWDSTFPVLFSRTKIEKTVRAGVPLSMPEAEREALVDLKQRQGLLHELAHRLTLRHKIRLNKTIEQYRAFATPDPSSPLPEFFADPKLQALFLTRTGREDEPIIEVLLKLQRDTLRHREPVLLEHPLLNEKGLVQLFYRRSPEGRTSSYRAAVLDYQRSGGTPIGFLDRRFPELVVRPLVPVPERRDPRLPRIGPGQALSASVLQWRRQGYIPLIIVRIIQGEIMDGGLNLLNNRTNPWLSVDLPRIQAHEPRDRLQVGSDEDGWQNVHGR